MLGCRANRSAMRRIPEYIEVPIRIVNERNSESYGTELAVDWQVNEVNKLRVVYSYLHSEEGVSGTGLTPAFEGNGPEHQYAVSYFSALRPWLDVSAMLRYVDEVLSADIGAYTTADLRMAIKPCRNLEVALVGQDLFESSHPEFISELGRLNSYVQRRFQATVKVEL